MASSLNSFSITNPADKSSVRIDTVASKKAALTLRALNHKLRQQMIKLIDDNKQMPVTQIYVKLRLEQSVASQHLAILRRAELVETRRDGKFIFYTVNYARIKEVMKFVEDLTKK
ncbi:MAG TPA: transcriptional regulator [Chitinophagaceae bacterium]|jgi:DNA-binding transcriptional ArsR family regulator|nr:transcriptional regulator [Chitinophagaceae bacterium]HAN37788.1 transcriptional regulator [Chitinophagaceae bacterium]